MAERLYYGWIVTWTSFSVLAVTYGVQFSFGVLIPDIEADTGWSRTQVSLAYSLYVGLYSLLGFASGTLTDRFGPRPVIAAGGILLGTGYVTIGLATELWHLYLALGVIAAVGMSASFVPCNATVVRWFVRRRGQALSIAAAGTGLGGLLLPPAAGLLSSAAGWRATYMALGGLCGLWLLAASRLMVRSPEERGLTVDGDRPDGRSMQPVLPAPAPPPGRAPAPAPAGEDHSDLDTGRAIRTAAFWLIAALFAFTWVAVFFPLVHLAPFAESLGSSRAVASLAVGAIGVGGLLGRLISGAASDRFGRLTMLGVVIAVQAAAFAAFAASRGAWSVFPAAVAFGFGYGGSTTLFPAVVGDRFGRTHAGAIVGLLFAGAGSLAAVGPAVAGYLYDSTGSYRLSFVLSGCSNLVSLALVAALAVSMRQATGAPVALPPAQRPAGAPSARR